MAQNQRQFSWCSGLACAKLDPHVEQLEPVLANIDKRVTGINGELWFIEREQRDERQRGWQCVETLVRHQMNTAGIASHCLGSPLTVRTQVKYKLCNPPNKRTLNESAWMAGWELQGVRWKQECSWHLFNIIPQLLGAGRSRTEQNRFRPLNDKYLTLFLCPTGFPGTGQGSVLTMNLPGLCLPFSNWAHSN